MSRAASRASAATLALLWILGCSPAAPPERIVLITIDTLRADRVGAYGYSDARTTTLDRLAAEGVVFENAISPVPLTLPSHATMLTGLEPFEHGIRHNGLFKLPSDTPTLATHLADAGYETAAFVGAVVLHERHGLGRGFSTYDSDFAGRASRKGGGYLERRAGEVVDAALEWVENAPPKFFLWLHFYDPHATYAAPLGFSLAAAGRPYDGEVAYVDSEVGRLLAELEARFGPQPAELWVTSDHGEALGEHGEQTHSHSIYEATQHVPLIAWGAGIPAAVRVAPVVSLSDIAPTLAERAGAAPLEGASGRSLTQYLGGGSLSPRAGFSETVATQLDFGLSPLLGLRTERWKYIRAPRPELYDLQVDPRERSNVADDHPTVASDLDRALGERLVRTRAGARLTLDAAERQGLEALGYVAVTEVSHDLGVVGGADPKDHRGTIRALVGEAPALIAEGKYQEAYDLLAEIELESVLLYEYRARTALAAGHLAQAEENARAALELEPDSQARAQLATALELRGETEAAEAEYRRVLSVHGSLGGVELGLGRVVEARDRAEAAAHYRRALRHEESIPNATWRLAALSIEDGEVAAARTALSTLSDEALTAHDAAPRLAAAWTIAGQPEEALALLEAAHAAHPADPRVTIPYATRLDAAGRLPEAVERTRELVDARPGDPAALNAAAWFQGRTGTDLARARALAERAVSLAKNAATLDTLAYVELRAGRADLALQHVEEGLQLASGAEAAHLHFLAALAHQDLDRLADARAALAASNEAGTPPGEPWLAEREDLQRRLRAPEAENS